MSDLVLQVVGGRRYIPLTLPKEPTPSVLPRRYIPMRSTLRSLGTCAPAK
jgi:hypothetical protein